MPVLASEEKIAPKSILRHRPIGDGDSSSLSGKRSTTTTTVPVKKRASLPRPAEHTGDDIAEWHHIGGDTDEKIQPQQPQENKRPAAPTPPQQKPTQGPVRLSGAGLKSKHGPQHPQYHPLLYLGLGVCATMLLWILFSTLSGWFTNSIDTLRYGYPRTFQTDAWVGHNEQAGIPSHFIALNLKGHIEVIEFPGGDATHARVYLGPQLYSPDADLIPVTLTFADLTGDHKLDMIVTFQGTHVVFINDQGTFRAPLPAERPLIEKALQHLSS
jgi:hypothetical protein